MVRNATGTQRVIAKLFAITIILMIVVAPYIILAR